MARNEAIQTFGNLTLLMQSLNGSISNGPWNRKREQILLHSSLPINQQLHRSTEWDVVDIEARGLALFERAKTIWSFD